MSGKKVDLASLAMRGRGGGAAATAAPTFARKAARSAKLHEVAPNPLNTRVIDPESDHMQELIASLREHGQLEPCAVVTRDVFVRLYPEHADTVGDVAYVQITGGRRYAAAPLAGLAHLEILVRDQSANDRADWLSATAAENISRRDYDPVEEARAVELLVQECGGRQTEAAKRLSKTPPWVTQRLNLLRLDVDVQAEVSAGKASLREVRDLHTVDSGHQAAVLRQRKTERDTASAVRRTSPPQVPTQLKETDQGSRGPKGRTDERPAAPLVGVSAGGEAPAPRAAGAVAVVQQLGVTPADKARTLVAALSTDALRELVDALQDHLESVSV